MSDFSDLGLDSALSAAFAEFGFTNPTKIQRLAIPRILQKKDIFLQSETGTGKTFAYLAPIVTSIKTLNPASGPLALVVCPTQELSVQVVKQAEALLSAARIPMAVLALLGGSPLSRQESALKKKPHIVVGTPGRVADLAAARALRLDNLGFVVLDEADRLFSREYREHAQKLLQAVPVSACKILASATIPLAVRKEARTFMDKPESIDLLEEGVLNRDIEHWVFYVEHRKRIDFVRKLESVLKPSKCLVFASSGDRVLKAARRLAEMSLPADSLWARQEKEHRRVAIERFEKGSLRYLLTTDLGARGLDIPGISHILHLDVPEKSSGYIHRAGRTARAGEKGISIVLADARELRQISKIAVDRGFVFRTKVLAEGRIFEPPVEEFFAMVERGEAEKEAYRGRTRAGREGGRKS